MHYLSVCSGLEMATVAWSPLGWTPWGFSEIDPFACAILKLRYPGVPNLGDMTRFKDWPDATLDVLAGGTPCQSYSIAGLRGGLDDPRGDLMLTYAAIARRYRPRWLVWENVFGVLSSDKGRDFGTLLGLLSGTRIQVPAGGWQSAGVVAGYQGAYGLAWRVLDTQFVRVDGAPRALPQRRRRVFVVGCLADWRRAAAVLLEREGLSGNPAPRRSAQQAYPGHSAQGAGTRGSVPEVANPLTARMFKGVNTTMDEGQTMIPAAIAFDCKASGSQGFGVGEISPTLRGMSHKGSHQNGGGQVAVAFQPRFVRNGRGAPDHIAAALTAEARRTGKGDSAQCVATDYAVRRLTPEECERLQGLPDGYTNIPWRGQNGAPDGLRYRVLGNTQSRNVMRWVGERIQAVHNISGIA